jgi:hypothetical protein
MASEQAALMSYRTKISTHIKQGGQTNPGTKLFHKRPLTACRRFLPDVCDNINTGNESYDVAIIVPQILKSLRSSRLPRKHSKTPQTQPEAHKNPERKGSEVSEKKNIPNVCKLSPLAWVMPSQLLR